MDIIDKDVLKEVNISPELLNDTTKLLLEKNLPVGLTSRRLEALGYSKTEIDDAISFVTTNNKKNLKRAGIFNIIIGPMLLILGIWITLISKGHVIFYGLILIGIVQTYAGLVSVIGRKN